MTGSPGCIRPYRCLAVLCISLSIVADRNWKGMDFLPLSRSFRLMAYMAALSRHPRTHPPAGLLGEPNWGGSNLTYAEKSFLPSRNAEVIPVSNEGYTYLRMMSIGKKK